MQLEVFDNNFWNVIEVCGNDSMLLANGNRCKGTTHYFHHEIYIDKDMTSDEKRRTLIHELSHAMLYCTQLEAKESFTEEDVCEFTAIYADKICKLADEYFKAQ